LTRGNLFIHPHHFVFTTAIRLPKSLQKLSSFVHAIASAAVSWASLVFMSSFFSIRLLLCLCHAYADPQLLLVFLRTSSFPSVPGNANAVLVHLVAVLLFVAVPAAPAHADGATTIPTREEMPAVMPTTKIKGARAGGMTTRLASAASRNLTTAIDFPSPTRLCTSCEPRYRRYFD